MDCFIDHRNIKIAASIKVRRDKKERITFVVRSFLLFCWGAGIRSSERNNLNGCFGTVTEGFCKA